MNIKSKASDWITVKVKEDLIKEIDKEIANTTMFGASKYRSRSDFVKFACLALLKKERAGKKAEGVGGGEGGEEIILARK